MDISISSTISLLFRIKDWFKKLLSHPKIKKWLWKLRNKKINIILKSYRKYYKNIEVSRKDMNSILKIVIQVFKKNFGGIENEKHIGANYILVIPKNFSVPIRIMIIPNIEQDYCLSERDFNGLPEPLKEKYIREYQEVLYSDTGKDCHIGTTISIDTFGKLTFTYNEEKNYDLLLESIDEIYERIEHKFKLHKPYEKSYMVKAIIPDAKIEEDLIVKKDENDNWKLEIKKSRVIIWTKISNPLRNVFDYLLQVPTL